MKDKKKIKKSSVGIATLKDEEQEITELIARKQKESPLPGQQRLRYFYNYVSIHSIIIIIFILFTT